MENQKPTRPKDPAAKPVSPGRPAGGKPAPAAVPAAPFPIKVPPLFRKIDWLTMLIAFGVVWIVYFLTLAPEVTLEDSGELCTGAFYAGIPHPPGYPFWSIYSWLWTELLPVGNVAWRVEVGESTAAALACGMVGLMVSRGSSMLVEGIEDLKGLTGRWESAICMVSGAVAGISLGVGGVMWSESVAINRISLFGVPWVMTVLLFMMRWIYAPHQRRYLFFAMLAFGICATIHQTLLCASLGIEVTIALTRPRLGRMCFLGNSAIFLAGFMDHLLKGGGAGGTDVMLLYISLVVGILSIAAYIWLAIETKEGAAEFGLDGSIVAMVVFFALAFTHSPVYGLLGLAGFVGFAIFAVQTWKLGHEWLPALICALLVLSGALFYLWEPISGMTNPPMEWGYPRTVEGFWHAILRGQYEQAHPTNLTTLEGWRMFFVQLGILISGIAEEYNWLMLFAALVPLLFIMKVQKRERSWLIGLAAAYLCIGILLVILMNPQEEKQSVDLHKVFFTSSHGLLAIFMGYGMTLIAAHMVTNYRRFRTVGLMLGGLALLPALMAFYSGICNTFFWGGEGIARYNYQILFFLVVTAAFVLMSVAAQMYLRTKEAPGPGTGDPKMFFMMTAGGAILCVLLAISLGFFNDRSLSLGQVFGVLPRMFSLRQANLPAQSGALVLVIAVAFVAGLAVYRDRAPLALTLGLFALMPVASIMSHWAASEQRNHWFGYWYGHDMFSAPFAGPGGQPSYDPALRAAALKGTNADLVYPEIEHNAILFGGTDPGRFTPTYMIFCESFIPHKDQPIQDQNYDRRDVYIITQNALADDTYLDYLRAQYNRSQQVDPPFFQELLRSSNEIHLNYTTNLLARIAYQMLDKPLTRMGANVEARRRAEGVYPPKEIYIPSAEDLSRTFSDYMTDVQQRYTHDADPRFNGEPRQLKAGEQPTPTADGRMTISGQVSVMAVNGLLTKLIFENNPTNEFYVEESFPLDWMFPHLTPYGNIMKINRQPVPEITPEIIRRDHDFWSRYSDRAIGNWITYDTTVKEITDFVDKAFVQHDFTGFTGNRAFMRDESAQKSFSKLRTAIAGLYAWRLGLLNQTPTPQEYLPRSVEAQQRMIHEADFAYRQAFAYCPYSPEVVYRYVQFLATFRRYEDARLVAETCLKLDPNNESIANMVHELQGSPSSGAPPPQNAGQGGAALAQLEKEVQENPTNLMAAAALAQEYFRLQQGTKCTQVLDAILASSNADGAVLSNVVGLYYSMQNFQKLEAAFRRLTQVCPDVPENWYNLASLEAALGQKPEALKDLQRALDENAKRLARDPSAFNLQSKAASDPNFASIKNSPEFQALISTPK